MTDFVAIPAVTVVCWFIGLLVKTLSTSEKLDRCIPCICGALGLIICTIIFYTDPTYISADNVVTAMAIGIASGFSATAIDQIKRQFTKE